MQEAKEIVKEHGRPELCLVHETSIDAAMSTAFPNKAFFEERRKHKMDESECDDGSDNDQRGAVTNQQRKYTIHPEGSARYPPKPLRR